MRNSLIGFLIVTSLIAGCSKDKAQQDCLNFDKGFLDVCNKSCPPKCTEMALQSEAVKNKYSKNEIEEKCKTSCNTHCNIQLEKVRPKQCLAQKK